MEKVRIDKWLWAVRIFKTRSIATAAVKGGKVKVGEKLVKPAYLLRVGEEVHVRKEGFNLVFLAKALLNKRVSAVLAAPCYDNLTSQEELNKYKDWYIGKSSPERREKGAGRPTKRERRELEDYKEDTFFLEED